MKKNKLKFLKNLKNNKIILKIGNFIFGGPFFSIVYIIVLAGFHILYWNKEKFIHGYDPTTNITEGNMTFLYYSLLIFMSCMIIYSAYLIYYERITYYYKERFTKKGFEKYIENEYYKHKETFFSGIGFFLTFSIGTFAIYMSLISMQTNLDIASSKGSTIDLSGTEQMFELGGTGIAMLIVVFIYCFSSYKLSIFWKNRFIKELYFDRFYKKKYKTKD